MKKFSDREKREEFNYRSKDGFGCIQCMHCDGNNKLKVRANGIESECLLLEIKVDDSYICDLIS